MRVGTWLFTAALGLALVGASARADEKLTLESKFPTVGKAEAVTLTGADDPAALRLRVVYRPNSETSVKKTLGAFDAEGRISWTPKAPGLTVLEAIRPDGKDKSGKDKFKSVTKLKVATCYARTPVRGLVVMILAGILLFGGAAVSLWMALRRTPEA
jgi:hypothetical protein